MVERSAETAHLWFREVAAELGTDDERTAIRALRTVLHALRDRLTVEEAAQLSSQLPTLIRGIYYEEWRPGAPRRMEHDVDSFLRHVRDSGGMAGETEASHAVASVARVLRRHVSEGEMRDVLAVLPADLRPLFEG